MYGVEGSPYSRKSGRRGTVDPGGRRAVETSCLRYQEGVKKRTAIKEKLKHPPFEEISSRWRGDCLSQKKKEKRRFLRQEKRFDRSKSDDEKNKSRLFGDRKEMRSADQEGGAVKRKVEGKGQDWAPHIQTRDSGGMKKGQNGGWCG